MLCRAATPTASADLAFAYEDEFSGEAAKEDWLMAAEANAELSRATRTDAGKQTEHSDFKCQQTRTSIFEMIADTYDCWRM